MEPAGKKAVPHPSRLCTGPSVPVRTSNSVQAPAPGVSAGESSHLPSSKAEPEVSTSESESVEEIPREIQVNVGIVAGRLKLSIDKWESLTADKFIFDCVRGYKLEFFGKVRQDKKPNVIFNSEREFLECFSAVELLIKKGAIEFCKPVKGQFLSSYFLVPKADGSFRFILNLKKLNNFIHAPHFKLENIRTASKLIFPGYFMDTIDLQDAYYLVPIAEESRKYLRFEFDGK